MYCAPMQKLRFAPGHPSISQEILGPKRSPEQKKAAKLNFITIIVITTIIVAKILIRVIEIRIRIKNKREPRTPRQRERLLSGGFPWPSERCKEEAESERALVTGRARGFRVSGSGGGGGGEQTGNEGLCKGN